MKEHHAEWLDEYLAAKSTEENAFSSLMRLCQRFSHRYVTFVLRSRSQRLLTLHSHGFSVRTPVFTKVPTPELELTRANFSVQFWEKYGNYPLSDIYNADETGIFLDTPPHRMWAKRGGSAKITTTEKHSLRMTAVLTVRADGTKLPIFFIVRAMPGGYYRDGRAPYVSIWALLCRAGKCLDGCSRVEEVCNRVPPLRDQRAVYYPTRQLRCPRQRRGHRGCRRGSKQRGSPPATDRDVTHTAP